MSTTKRKTKGKKPVRDRRGGRASGQARHAGQAAGRGNRLPAPLRGLKSAEGCGAAIIVVEQAGGGRDQVEGTHVVVQRGPGRRIRPGSNGRAVGRRAKLATGTCAALAALGHAQRVKLLLKLLDGPATYRALKRVSKLKPGPLYHHINQLRLAGLILPKQRDLYELTRGGRNLILTVLAVEPLIRDTRRRPMPPE